MARDLYLVAPLSADNDDFPARLKAVLDVAPVAALLLPRAGRDDKDYAAFSVSVRDIAQSRDCAVLLEDSPALAKEIGADGVHMTGGIKAFHEAVRLLKPDLIVGAGNVNSRHDAMEKAEAGADYLLFGDPETGTTPDDVALAAWWAETFEIPSVLFEPDSTALEEAGVEFVALGTAIWSLDPADLSSLLDANGVLA